MPDKSSQSGPQQGRQPGEQATRERQAELGRLAQSIGEQGLTELQRKIARGEPLNLTVDEIVRLVTNGVELERSARGEHTEGSAVVE